MFDILKFEEFRLTEAPFRRTSSLPRTRHFIFAHLTKFEEETSCRGNIVTEAPVGWFLPPPLGRVLFVLQQRE